MNSKIDTSLRIGLRLLASWWVFLISFLLVSFLVDAIAGLFYEKGIEGVFFVFATLGIVSVISVISALYVFKKLKNVVSGYSLKISCALFVVLLIVSFLLFPSAMYEAY